MSGEGFLRRWSRLKRAEPEPATPPAEAPAAPATALTEAASSEAAPSEAAVALPEAGTLPPAAVPPAAAEAEPEFDLASLPSIESLTAETDVTVFLRAGVPRALRDAALRRIWTLDPAIRDFIGPADYAWDFNAPDGVPGFSLELGGDVKKLLAQAIGEEAEEERRQKAAEAAAAAAEATAGDAAAGADSIPAEPIPADPAADPAAEPPLQTLAGAPAEGGMPDMAERAAAAGEEQPDALPAAEPGLPRRRHGGAVPT